tara:strand:+ start:286 stop:597 length:312 start_codon:yes stop_codon:yes gene_type:complete
MIKEVEMIKMRKDIEYLIQNYFFSRSGLAKALDILPKVLRDFVVDNVTPQDANFYKMHNKIKAIKEQIKEAEKYQPLEQPQDKKQNHEWLLMHELLEKQNEQS